MSHRPKPIESFARILLFAIGDVVHATLLVTSAYANEGKTSVTANLAISLAATGKRVGLVDFDLRHPDLHNLFGADNDFGVSDVLLNRRPLEDCFSTSRSPVARSKALGVCTFWQPARLLIIRPSC